MGLSWTRIHQDVGKEWVFYHLEYTVYIT
jgi:hypothetical protein